MNPRRRAAALLFVLAIVATTLISALGDRL